MKKILCLALCAATLASCNYTTKREKALTAQNDSLVAVLFEQNAALDEAMAVKLMPALTTALDGRIPREDRSLSETLDAIFGDDHTVLCRKAVKESGADLA